MSSPTPKPTDTILQPTEQIRENMVQTAVNFLLNERVVNTSLADKQKFLQKKGLTDQEIQIACERSGAYVHYEEQKRRLAPALIDGGVGSHFYNQNFRGSVELTVLDRIKDILHNVAVFSVVAYFLHKFYQNYIAPFLFGKKPKSIDATLNEVKTSIDDLKLNLNSVKSDVDKLGQHLDSTSIRKLSDLKSDLATVKGLLLNRKQFPSVSNSPVVPPSIPAWQMSSVRSEGEDEEEADSETKEELLEMGFGSEPEHGTKTSESSLEIIYTSRDCDSESGHSRKSKEEVEKE